MVDNAKSVNESFAVAGQVELDQLPKPTLIHCAGGMRASAIALLSIAPRKDSPQNKPLQKRKNLATTIT